MKRNGGGFFEVEAGQVWPEWTPQSLREWLASIKSGIVPFDPRLLLDARMRPVWQWFVKARFNDVPNKSSAYLSISRKPLAFCTTITKATSMPGKPGNLPPKERAAYLKRVRGHALELLELLDGTLFSAGDIGKEIDPDNLEKQVVSDLGSWGADEMGHVVAFWVDEDGVFNMPWDYPQSHLCSHLHDLVSWTRSDDYFDRSIMRSSKPIGQARSRNARTIYFTCTLHEEMADVGLQIPFSLLATIANVALSLPARDVVDEETVRKQVRRYQQKHKDRESQRASDSEIPF